MTMIAAYITYDKLEDAESAIRYMDGKEFMGEKLRVEHFQGAENSSDKLPSSEFYDDSRRSDPNE